MPVMFLSDWKQRPMGVMRLGAAGRFGVPVVLAEKPADMADLR